MLLSALLLICGSVYAENAAVSFTFSGAAAAGDGFVWKSNGKKLLSTMIPVDPARYYILCGSLKSDEEVKNVTFGLELLNGSKHLIHSHSVRAIEGTETRLVKGANKGDNAIFVQDAAKWKIANGRVVALWVKTDLKDLPARAFAYYIKSIDQMPDKSWCIEFTNPIIYNIAAGSLIRQHSDAREFAAAYRITLNGKRSFRHLIAPGSRYFSDARCWWPGVRFARVSIQAPAGAGISFSDIVLRPAAAAEIKALSRTRPAAAVMKRGISWPGNGAKTVDANAFLWSSDGKKFQSAPIKINRSAHYILSGEFTAKGDVSNFSFGLELLRKNGRPIHTHTVYAVAGTETRLVKGARKGDSAIFVEDASNWNTANGKIISLWAAPDLRDLPSQAFAYYIDSIKKMPDNSWRIGFSKPMNFTIAAGRFVRQHNEGPAFFAVRGIKLDRRTRRFTHLIAPAGNYTRDSRCWWPGTESVRITLQAPDGTQIECRNIKLQPISGAQAAEIKNQQTAAGERCRPYGSFTATGSGNEITAAPGSGFFMNGLSWPADKTKQIEMRVRSSQAGMLETSLYGKDSSGQGFRLTESRAVVPDGKYHWQMLHPQLPSGKSGTINEIRMVWRSEFSTDLEIADLRRSEMVNLVPGKGKTAGGRKILLDYVQPRKKYLLKWLGKSNPGMKFTAIDRNEKPLTEYTLSSGENEKTVAMPALAVRAQLTVSGGGSGRPLLAPLADSRPKHTWRGSWIWSQKESGPEWTNVWFRREFDISGTVEQAALAIAADDHPQIWINGTEVGSGGSYVSANCFDIAKFLRPGKNTVIIRVLNGSMNGGLLCDLYYRAGGKDNYVCSGPEWKLFVGGRTMPEKINTPVLVVGKDADKTAPWAGRLDYRYAGPRIILTDIKTSVNSFSAEYKMEDVELPRFLRVRAVTADGSERILKLDAGYRLHNGRMTVDYRPPFPTSERPVKLYLCDDKFHAAGNDPIGEISPLRQRGGFSKARYADVGGRTKLIVDGKEYSPSFWAFNTSIKSNPAGQVELIAEARDAGFRNFPLLVEFTDFWLGPGKYDFSKIDARALAVLDLCPDAIFLLQAGCWMPEWWLKANPDEVTAHAVKAPRHLLESQALSSKKWLQDAKAPIKALMEYLKTRNYSRKIWGVSVAENRNWEWFWTIKDGNDRPAVAGYSKGDLAAFRDMLRRKYQSNEKLAAAWKSPGVTFDTAQMPPPELHRRGRIGTLLDPEKDRQLIDWFEYRNLSLAEAVIHLCREFKKASGNNWLAGAYYGYFTEMAVNYGRPVHDHGHNGYLETAMSSAVDFVRAPTRYHLRKIGLADGNMIPQDTYKLRNKVVYIECDLRTAFRRTPGVLENYVAHPVTAGETVAAMNRAFGMMLATGTAHYWYDILRGSFREPLLNDLLREQNELYQKLPPLQDLMPREVAVVIDRDSSYFTKRNAPDTILPLIFAPLLRNITRIGTPHRIMSVEDLLDDIPMPPHRFYIMANSFMMSKEQREKLMARFEKEKAVVLWLYAPGAFYPEQGPKAEYCGDFLGLKTYMSKQIQKPVMKTAAPLPELSGTVENAFAPWFYPESEYSRVLARDTENRPVLVSLKKGNAVHIFSTLPEVPVELMRHFAAEAGIHLYTPDASDHIHVGNDVLFIHAAKGGKKRFILPHGIRLKGIIGPMKGRELASGEEWMTEAGMTNGFLLYR